MKKTFRFTAILIVGLMIGWLAIGPDWRAVLRDPPSNTQVLAWSQSQRDAGFRMMDRVPFVSQYQEIAAGGNPSTLPPGPALPIDMDVDQYMIDNRHSALVILHKGQVRLEKYGLGFSGDKRWTSFSVAKSLTSTLFGAAIKDELIDDLSDPVSKYVPGLAGSAYDDVTLEQLLTMTSGVKWSEDYGDPEADVAKFNHHVPKDGLPQVVSYLRTLPRAHPAGEVWNYSSGETNLIGTIVSNVTGKPLAAYLSEKIWVPVGMEADATWLIDANGIELSGCCVQARTRDMARFGQFILDGGVTRKGDAVLPSGWIAAATSHQASYGVPGQGYGYQWWSQEDGSFMADGIFGQGIFIDPSRDLVIATNASWSSALGEAGGELERRAAFHAVVQAAIDSEESI